LQRDFQGGGLVANALDFPLVGIHFTRGHEIAGEGIHADARLLFRLDEDFQVRLDVRLVADFLKQKRIDVAAGGDEIQIAANTGLRRVDVAEVVRAVDNPKIFVAGSEVENFLVFGQHDKSRVAQFGMDSDDVIFAVLHDASGVRSGPCWDLAQGEQSQNGSRQQSEKVLPFEDGYSFHLCSF
jgi:hypothetical protein